MTNARQRQAVPRQATWAGVEFSYVSIHDEAGAQTAQRVAQGIEGQRIDLVGVVPTFWADLSGGMIRRGGIHPTTDLNQVYYNQGIITHNPYQAVMGYQVVTQATFDTGDYTGYRAANKRMHAVLDQGRFIVAYGISITKDTSSSDPTLGSPADITDNITAMWTGMFGTTPGFIYATDGTTNDALYSTDQLSTSNPWVTYGNSADVIFAGQYFPTLGNGYHVFVGRMNNSPSSALGVWYVSKDATLPVASSAALPVVYTDSKDIENTGTATTTLGSYVFPTAGGNLGQGEYVGSGATAPAGIGTWIGAGNTGADDNSNYATYSAASDGASGVGGLTSYLYASGYDFTSVPRGAKITGIEVVINCKESNAGMDAYLAECQLLAGGSVVGDSLIGTGAELGTSDADITIGSSTVRWGTDLTGQDVQQLSVRIRFAFGFTANATYTISVDSIKVKLTYRMPGTQLKVQSGGFTCGPWPSRPNTLVYIEPESDDETGVTKQRRLCLLNLSYDPAGDRITAEIEYPDTGLSYVEDVCPWQGGLLLTGNKSSGLGKQVKHVDSQGRVRQYRFPGFHGTEAVGVCTIFDEGSTALFDVAHEDGSNAQHWRLVDTQFHAEYPQQDLSSAISVLPLAWAERTLHKSQNRVYRFYPVSTTHLAVSRSFVPRDPFSDPLMTNTSEVKQDGPLYLITPEFEIGQFENQNTLMLVRHGGRQISATASTYGTVQYQFELSTDSADIDTTFASPDVDTSALNTRFAEYQVPTNGKPFRTLQGKIILDNARSSSTKTPNALPFYTETVSSRPHLSLYRVYVDWANTAEQTDDWLNFVARLKAAAVTQRINALEIGGLGVTTDLVGWSSSWEAEDIEQALNRPALDSRGRPVAPWLLFREVRGSVS